MPGTTLFSIGEALIDMIPSRLAIRLEGAAASVYELE